MPSLGGTKTEQNLKDAFAGRSRLTDVISISHRKRTSKATTMWRLCSGLRPKAKLAMRMVI